jgi:hypothetical protein
MRHVSIFGGMNFDGNLSGMPGSIMPGFEQKKMDTQHPFAPPLPPYMMNHQNSNPAIPEGYPAALLAKKSPIVAERAAAPAASTPPPAQTFPAKPPAQSIPGKPAAQTFPGKPPAQTFPGKPPAQTLPTKPVKPTPTAVQTGGLLGALTSVISKTKTKTEVERKNDLLEQVKNDKLRQALSARQEKVPPKPKPAPVPLEVPKEIQKELQKELQKDDTPITELLKSTPGPVTPGAGFNWKKKLFQKPLDAKKSPQISPDKPITEKPKTNILKELINEKPTPEIVLPIKSPLAQKLPTEKEPVIPPIIPPVIPPAPPPKPVINEVAKLPLKEPEKTELTTERRKEKSKKRKIISKPELVPEELPVKLPPDPGYIPKVRITTYRNLSGGTLHSSNQFKPGEERVSRTRSTRKQKIDWESKTVDINEFTNWEKTHFDRKRKRRRLGMGLPSDEEGFKEEQMRRHNEDKRRQDLLEKEPVKLEDETNLEVNHLT